MVQRINLKNINESGINTINNNNRDRSNHYGTQLASTISDFSSSVRGTVLTGLSSLAATTITAGDTFLTAVAKLQAQINNSLKMFFSSQTAPVSGSKVWIGETTVSGGNWSVNYTSAGFTQVYGVFAQAEASGTSNTDANYASVNHSTVTKTTASGRCSNAVTAGLLVATVNQASSNGTKIKVFVFGS